MIMDMLLSRKIRCFNIRIAAGITVLSLFLFAGSVAAYPPPAILKIDGNEQTSGIAAIVGGKKTRQSKYVQILLAS